MGAESSVERQNRQLIVQNRLLVRSVCNDRSCNGILDVKKNKRYTHLNLEGGFVSALSYIGAMGYLHDNQYLANITKITCSGFGSVIAILHAVGYTVPELKILATELDTNTLFSTEKPLRSDIFHVATEYGGNGQHLMDVIANYIEQKTGDTNYDLETLYRQKGVQLEVNAADISTRARVRFDHVTYPKIPLRILARIACTVPSVLAPVVYDGHYLVDAGECADLGQCSINLAILPDLSVDSDVSQARDVPVIDSYQTYLRAVVSTRRAGETRHTREPVYWLQTVPIHVPDVAYCNYTLSPAQKVELLRCGFDACRDFFEQSI